MRYGTLRTADVIPAHALAHAMMTGMRRTAWVLVLATAAALPVYADDSLQLSGFALLRGAVRDDGPPPPLMEGQLFVGDAPLDDDAISAQVQLGIDWRPSSTFFDGALSYGGHAHLLARNESDGGHRARAGVVEAYVDQTLSRGAHRLRLMEGAFFLPTSRENIDALWESPYTITSSALNSWFGEELRPVGIDAAYTLRRQWTAGVTVFTGNDTLGSLPAVRRWSLRDHWALLGEHLPVDGTFFTSVSAETDHRLGWAARGRWNSDRASLQFTHLDNRADALPHGDLYNWDTRFEVIGGDFTLDDWNFIAEYGWGETDIINDGIRYTDAIAAGYVLVSRMLANGRVSIRADQYEVEGDSDHAITLAYFWSPRGKVRAGIEGIVTGEEKRLAVELRYHF
jgi:hypothetical protein